MHTNTSTDTHTLLCLIQQNRKEEIMFSYGIYIHTRALGRVCMCVRACVYARVSDYTRTYARVCVYCYAGVCVCACVCACMCVYTYVCVSECDT